MPDGRILVAAAIVGALYFGVVQPVAHGVKVVGTKIAHVFHHPKPDQAQPQP